MNHKPSLPFLAAASLLVAPSLHAQGDLDPAGPPSPAMKRLDQLNAGTPITEAPFVIDSPGRYYAAANLLGEEADPAVHITTSNVTLDLNGFAITSVHVFHPDSAQLENIVVSNGRFPTGTGAVFLSNVSNSTLTGLNIKTLSWGVNFLAVDGGRCDGNRVEACAIEGGADPGVYFFASMGTGCSGNLVKSCVVTGTTVQSAFSLLAGEGAVCNGNVIEDCLAGDGANANSASFSLSGGSGTVSGNRIARCASFDSQKDGILIQGIDVGRADGNTVRHCAIANAGRRGIVVQGGVALSGSVRGNRIESCPIARSGFGENTPAADPGIFLGGTEEVACLGNVLTGCIIYRSEDDGIVVRNAEGTRLDGNHVHTAGSAIVLDRGTANFLTGSTVVASTIALVQSFGATNTVGPQVFSTGLLPNGTHWLSNFSRP